MLQQRIIYNFCLVLSLMAATFAAPTTMNKSVDEKISDEKPLVRTKRADDISNENLAPLNSDDTSDDITSDDLKAPTDDSRKLPEEINDVINADKSDTGSKDDASETMDEGNLEFQPEEEEEEIDPSEEDEPLENEDDKESEERAELENDGQEEKETWSEGEAAAEVEREEQEEEGDRWEHASDENPWDMRQSERDRVRNELEEVKRRKRDAQQQQATSDDLNRDRRSPAHSENRMMIAENMMADSSHQRLATRSKRDLESDENDDEMRDLFGGGVDAEPEEEEDFKPEEENNQWGYEPTDDVTDEDNDDDTVPYREQLENDDDVEDKELELAKELLAEKAAEEARQAVLKYLMGAAGESVANQPVVIPEAMEVRPGEEWDNDELTAEAFNERRGFKPSAPAKRYPYSYEPYGGQWGAFVPGMKRATAEAYERLYELAEALDRNS